MDQFDEIAQSLQADASKAQILLEIENEGNTLDEALEILEAHGGQPIEYEVIRKGDPSLVIFYLSTDDMRDAILKLTESGFAKLKGMDTRKVASPINLKRD
jgi:hypothetical protein